MSYPIDVRSVLEALASARTVTGEIEIGEVELGEQTYGFVGPVTFSLTITNTGERAVAAFGTAEGTVRTQCVRCLCDFDAPVTAEVDGYYVFPGHDDEIPEEQEFEHISDDLKIDIEPAVRQAMVVDLPFAPVHDPDCRGICPVCGCDRNTETCSCDDGPDATGPFAGLKGLLGE